MKDFAPYVRELEALVAGSSAQFGNQEYEASIAAALDGQPGTRLRENIPLETLREAGAFFTGEDLAKELIKSIHSELASGAVIADPACGAGNLLTVCAHHLPIQDSLEDTLESWADRLFGVDIHEEFTRATKARLTLVALSRGARLRSKKFDFSTAFPNIVQADAFQHAESVSSADCVVLNPAFTVSLADKASAWASGKVSSAALFLEICVLKAKPGAKIMAILPDVLRTGSHYLRWRKHIERHAKVNSVEIVGLFDAWTDVDVFILRLTVGGELEEGEDDWWKSCDKVQIADTRIGDLFDIRVGPVVPHRDPHKGRWFPFIHAHDLPAWKTVNSEDFLCRRFSGTTYEPPFVVIRRTSRPGDKNRTVATIIKGKRPVAVENHLVVLKPKNGSLQQCLASLEKFRCSDTSVWLNERIRCRHLTVSSIGEIPWWP